MSFTKTRPGTWTRLTRMSWQELQTRSRQEISKRWDAVLYHLGADFHGDGSGRSPEAQAHFFFTPEEVPAICDLLRERLPLQAEQIHERAERICQHRFDLLGYANLDYGEPIDWHLDVVHGKRAPRKPWYQIHFLDFNEVGDSKIIWELNRHQHLVTLAKAYRLTQDERFAAELFRQWYHWQQENPYPLGINWASSLEVAFRSLSWIWVGRFLTGCAAVPEKFSANLTRALALNGRHIERYLSTYFSPNTHLLGEAVALFFIGTLYRQIPAARRWRQRAWETLLQEACRQVQADGMHFEQSTYYHVYALDFFLHARILAAVNELPIRAEFDGMLEKMLTLLCRVGQGGSPPRLGDDDGGRVFDPHRNRAEHLLDPLATGAALFRRSDFKAAARGPREETLWLLGPEGMAEFDRLPSDSLEGVSTCFEPSGIYVMASAQPVPQQVVIHAGPMGADSAGHSHADALSLHLSLDGRAWLTDPGTYAYVSPGAERDLFRGTAAHNTLQVDGAPQAEPDGPFSWRSKPALSVESWVAGKTFDFFIGSHNGYCRLPHPVVHRRWIFHLKSRFWLVRDLAAGEGVHQLDLFWHLAPGSTARSVNASLIRVSSGNQRALAFLTPEGNGGSQAITEGWWSPAYGSKQASPVLRFSKRAALPAEFVTLLLPVAESSAEPGRLEQVKDSLPRGVVCGYRYGTSQEIDVVFLGNGEHWETAGWASDARFLYCGLTSAGALRQAIFCAGSFVEREGQRLFEAKHPVARCEWHRVGGARHLFCSDPAALLRLPGEAHPKMESVLRGPESPDSTRGER